MGKPVCCELGDDFRRWVFLSSVNTLFRVKLTELDAVVNWSKFLAGNRNTCQMGNFTAKCTVLDREKIVGRSLPCTPRF